MPIFVDLDVVFFVLLACRAHSLFVGVFQNILAVIVMDCVQNIEEVLPIAVLSFRERIWHEHHELRVLAQFRPQLGDRKFIVGRNVDSLDFIHFQEFFLPGEN